MFEWLQKVIYHTIKWVQLEGQNFCELTKKFGDYSLGITALTAHI